MNYCKTILPKKLQILFFAHNIMKGKSFSQKAQIRFFMLICQMIMSECSVGRNDDEIDGS